MRISIIFDYKMMVTCLVLLLESSLTQVQTTFGEQEWFILEMVWYKPDLLMFISWWLHRSMQLV